MAVQNQIASNRTRAIALLGAGDVAAIVTFAALGVRSHATTGTVPYVLETAAPFVVSWLAIAPFIGAYRSDLLTQPRRLLTRTLLAWALALFPGVLLRTVIRQSVFPQLSFAVTTFLIIGLLLCGWRWLFSWLLGRGGRNGN